MTLAERILSHLGGAVPVRTPDLVALAACGLSYPRSRVWACLLRLESGGLVRRVAVPGVRRAKAVKVDRRRGRAHRPRAYPPLRPTVAWRLA
jgi:hypothetical protein